MSADAAATPFHVVVERHRCASSGNCADIAPEVFTQDDATGLVELLDADPALDRHAAVRRAELVCPAQAIAVETTS